MNFFDTYELGIYAYNDSENSEHQTSCECAVGECIVSWRTVKIWGHPGGRCQRGAVQEAVHVTKMERVRAEEET